MIPHQKFNNTRPYLPGEHRLVRNSSMQTSRRTGCIQPIEGGLTTGSFWIAPITRTASGRGDVAGILGRFAGRSPLAACILSSLRCR